MATPERPGNGDAPAPVIAVHDLWMTFAGRAGEPIHVLERVDMQVRAGELVCIVGPSGCGKSTLLNIIGGFLRPTRGEVRLEGDAVRGPDPRRIFVFQENAVFPWLTVEENVGFGLLAKPAAARRDTVRHYLEMVGLSGFERAYPRELSGGMRQRVEIARALAADPDVIYMDEPFGALDFITRLKMRADLVRIWQAERKTILFVTHDIEEAVQLADRVFVMSRRPATIHEVIEVALRRPRDLDSAGYLRARDRIFASMGMSLSVGEPSPAAPTSASAGTATNTPRRFAPIDADVIVVGGGPAGSILGSYLARAGVHHLVLDKAHHPRPHIGESLVCSTTRIFQEIDFLRVIENEGFVRKRGAVWTHWAEPTRQHTLRFRDIPHLGIDQDYTYHVDRSRFDQLLLRHAAAQGSTVLEGAQVERVDFAAGGAACGVTMLHDGERRTLRSRVVVDASGRRTLLGTQLRLKDNDPAFHQFAVHNRFTDVDRGDAETADYIHVHISALPRTWIWLIPIGDQVTSVGVVTDREHFGPAGESGEEFFARHVAACPALARRMRDAQPLQDYVREANYSYVMSKFAGDGWLLTGDAARFIDPIFSSGLSIAAESARRAAAAIVPALQRGDVGAASFADYEHTMRGGLDIWRRFIELYYQLPPLFLELLGDPPAHRELTRLLQGEVYDGDVFPILEQMRERIAQVAADPAHPWRSQLGLDT